MITTPKVSVLMPVYNTKEEYLREAIESILNQTFKDFEFIIIDDGSKNSAKDIILSYKDSRIKYFYQENQGIISALNNGLEKCKGEYIARMDSDDISLKERLQKQVEFMDNNKNIGIVGAYYKKFPQNEEVCKYKERPKYIDFIKKCELAHPVVMLRKEIFDKYKLKYENFKHAEDYELWSRAIKYTNAANIQEILLHRRMHENSITQMHSRIQYETSQAIRKNMINFLTDDPKVQQKIWDIVLENPTFLQKMFSINTKKLKSRNRTIIYLMGLKFTVKNFFK